MNFEKALESVRTIKLTGGVFGKTSLVLVVLCICTTAIAIKIGTWWFGLIVFIPMMGLIAYSLKRVLDFAEKNPQAAIMDGAELLVHEKIVHGMKGRDSIDTETTIDHSSPVDYIDQDDINQEDRSPTSTSVEGENK